MSRKYPPVVASEKTTPRKVPEIPRRFARAAVDLPAQYAIEGQPEWHACVVDDLGGGGVRLQTQEDVAAGTVVTLRFDIDGLPIGASGRVAMSLFDRSRDRFIHGVAFTAIDAPFVAAIERRVNALQPDEKP